MANRLAGESSPYLLQHKDNPVDWYPWGAEAFALARAEDKPVFISIGYAACHWCHVMAHESFESPDIARLMNELFVNIKIDREERPDVDAIYMNAIHVMGEGGGWPLSAFCTPDGKPYFLGTYFPPADRYGRPGFPQVLQAMARVYREERERVEHNTAAIMDGLEHIDQHVRRGAAQADPTRVDQGLLVTAGRALAQRSDPRHGGLGTKPKFPSSSAHDLLGRCGRLSFGKPAREAFLLQATKMARGGIYDHLGGGFARYSVDEKWLVPHFEKMLYDNGQLLAIYGDAYSMTADPDYARVIDETVGWLEREMLDESGGLYASQDADSEGEEGTYYVWRPEEIDQALGPADAIFFKKAYGVTEKGNFEHATTVLERVTERGPESEEAALAALREKLLARRMERVHPDTDTKILSGWNGLAVSGLLRAWEATGSQRALTLARTVAEFLAARMTAESGTLWRVFKDGRTKLEGTIDDYAFVGRAFMQMAEATGDAVWWERGAALVRIILDRFYEEPDGVGVFYMTPSDDPEPLIHRPESHSDGAIPSGAAVATECLLRLGLVAGEQRALQVAETYLGRRVGQAADNIYGAARLLAVLDYYLNSAELVVTEGPGAGELLTAARRAYAPTLMIVGSWGSPALLEGKESRADGHAQAYVCRGMACLAPVSDPEALYAIVAGEPA